MPLHVSRAPAPVLHSVLAALGSPSLREAGTPALRSVQGPLSAELPLPVHVLGVTAPADGTPGAPVTRLAGWRFLVRGGEASLAAADVLRTADGWAFSHFSEGPYLASTERALRQAEVSASPWQPRLLSVPDLYMLTLWLHGDPDADPAGGPPDPADVLVPLAPAPPGIAAHRPHRVADLLPRLAVRLAPPPLLGSTA
ncbi:hypothetical protein M4914_02000 [Streptomyces somaliensis DSM 40738]|uniref:Uncharacterized protein n=1 Tax=Streptomyces somaliensis (strain ATCC 33201 / DSM 40738 / JCM 12659 / KCTC 9044 / NCTC 11332 / NRRL B-12077 / IP 733) TaxID=1134445 RepID=A0AA44DC34_STRE0|nr:hypothetical protein [Streptomyces somaliensis]MCQ0021859.1 hypothetical protein [Streptomyces somaliensis DSM 40738]NKY13713.1 hypothetical protein [Streptomyces somaliensis DSM 40738]